MTGTDDEQRLLRIIGRMPLASAANLAPILTIGAQQLHRQLTVLQDAGWLASIRRGMSEQAQDRWFLTRRSVDSLYTTDHMHHSPREVARAASLKRLRPAAEDLSGLDAGFATDHDHLPHIEDVHFSPFAQPAPSSSVPPEFHEHPPWTATARGIRLCVRRLAMMEALYRIAPDLMRNDQVIWPADGVPVDASWHMTDFRMLRRGGFYHAVARYGSPIWVTFTYVGLHATERVLRRKQEHRFWGLDSYTHEQDHYFRIANRVFYEDPEQTVEPSAQVIIAADAWAADLARRTLDETAPTLICTADGHWGDATELCPSRDSISDPPEHPQLGHPEIMRRWRVRNRDLIAINGPAGYRAFTTIAQFPAMHASWLHELVGGSSQASDETFTRLVDVGLVVVFDERFYLAERGMRRAASLSRVLPGRIRSRHAAYLESGYRRQELRHNDGVNQIVLQFAREGVGVFAGWRGEINLPGITQVKPDLVALVADGPFGAGPYSIEYERTATTPAEVHRKLGPYRRSAWHGHSLPVLVICDTQRAVHNFENTIFGLPLLATDFEAAMAGPLTGDATVWTREGKAVSLHCRGTQ
ncbi:hypothetical protein [Candidatus Poriferisodalis sp.]|uniref:hypothetical protein n=1 Tax=Candidatus Poriferisodalis sp. TaxID=3101277 RepID=UPI003B5BA9BA